MIAATIEAMLDVIADSTASPEQKSHARNFILACTTSGPQLNRPILNSKPLKRVTAWGYKVRYKAYLKTIKSMSAEMATIHEHFPDWMPVFTYHTAAADRLPMAM